MLTSNSQRALKTFSSKLGSTRLGVSLCIVVSVSRRSGRTVDKDVSRQTAEVGDLPAESVLARGWGDAELPYGADEDDSSASGDRTGLWPTDD